MFMRSAAAPCVLLTQAFIFPFLNESHSCSSEAWPTMLKFLCLCLLLFWQPVSMATQIPCELAEGLAQPHVSRSPWKRISPLQKKEEEQEYISALPQTQHTHTPASIWLPCWEQCSCLDCECCFRVTGIHSTPPPSRLPRVYAGITTSC